MKKLFIAVLLVLLLAGCPKPDEEAPEVMITHPANGVEIYDDTVYVQITATDERGVDSVELYINDTLAIAFTKRPFEYYWITTNYPDSSVCSLFAIAYDYSGNTGYSDTISVTIRKNQRPIVSKPFGELPDEGIINTLYTFNATATDTDDDSVYIRFAWGDGDTSLWSSLVKSGDTISMEHRFINAGTYTIKAQAKDKRGRLSFWSEGISFKIVEQALHSLDGVNDFTNEMIAGIDPTGDITEAGQPTPHPLDLDTLWADIWNGKLWIGFKAYASNYGLAYGIYIFPNEIASSGATSDPWGRNVFYTTGNDTIFPTYILYFWHENNDSITSANLCKFQTNWNYTNIGSDKFIYNKNNDFLEISLPLQDIGNPDSVFIELFTTGGDKHAQDTSPDDPNVQFPNPDWSDIKTGISKAVKVK